MLVKQRGEEISKTQWSGEERERSLAKWIAKVNDTVILLKASYLKRRINDSVENLGQRFVHDFILFILTRAYISVRVCTICVH